MVQKTIRAAVVGGSGYTGAEMVRLLARHPAVELALLTSRQEAGRKVSALYPQLRGVVDQEFLAPDQAPLAECDVVFFATPAGVAQQMAPALLEAGARIIDLSADFRLRDAALWEQWYGQPHAAPQLLSQAVYGLPEYFRKEIAATSLVANPGCYPSAVLLGLAPLLEAGAVEPDSLQASAVSGLSGAGRSARVELSLSEAGSGVSAYAASGHRHLPEMEQVLRTVEPQAVLCFVPHLVPMSRGLHATLFARLREETDAQQLFEQRYADEPFVDVLPAGEHPHSAPLRGANVCRIAVHRPAGSRTLVVLSALDNLVKGAAGQALQNMNILFDLDERTGLEGIGLMP